MILYINANDINEYKIINIGPKTRIEVGIQINLPLSVFATNISYHIFDCQI